MADLGWTFRQASANFESSRSADTSIVATKREGQSQDGMKLRRGVNPLSPSSPQPTKRRNMHATFSTRSFAAAGLALLFASTAAAQVSFSQNFDANSTGWTGTGWARSATLACAGQSMRANLWSGATTRNLVSPSTGTAAGGTVTVTYDYKCYDFDAPQGPTASPWGNFALQYAASASGPWTTVATITDEVQTASCIAKSHSFTPPAGPLFLRWAGTWSAGDYYLVVDNVTVTESVAACSGTPTPGNTVGPAGACSGANFNLSLQNATSGTGVSYQWFYGPSNTGPWLNLGTAATQSVSQTLATWYYCAVTCGANTGNSAPVLVPMAVTAFPQDFSGGVVDPNCWSTAALVGTGLPNYATQSGFAVGTGSVRFNFYNISDLDQPTLISPEFAPIASGTQLYFDVAGTTYTGGEVDQIVLEESNDAGTTWTTVATMDNSVSGVLNTAGITSANYAPTASQWASLAFPLSTGTNRIRFRGVSNFGNNVFLDNIAVGVLPSARHTAYGRSCGTPAFTLAAAPAPVSTGSAGTTVVYSLGSVPLACPSPAPVFHFGILMLSVGQDFAGTDLFTGYAIEAPGCNLHIASLDYQIGYIGTTPAQTVNFDVPVGVPGGVLYYAQAAALICPVAPNNAGIIVSNAVRSFVNSF